MEILGAVSEKHYKQLETLAKFIGVDKLKYIDRGNSETVLLTKNGKTLKIEACGNKFDGGFFSIAPVKAKKL